MALVGHVDAISRAEVSGWATNPDSPGAPAEVAIFVNGERRATLHAQELRPGLAANTHGVASDHCGFTFAFEPPLSAFHEWRIEVADAATREVLRAGAHTLARPSRDGSATPAPIVVTSTGRSGTTLLMAELARNPAIVVAEGYPYEIKQIAYYASVFRALTAAADRERSVNPDTMLAPELLHLAGANPFYMPGFFRLAKPGALMRHFYESRVPARYAELFRSLILEFYEILRVSQDKPEAPFFCEKGDIDDAARQGVRLFFPYVRELLVVRDPRDLLASAIAFWKHSPELTLEMLKSTVPQVAAIHRQQAPDTLTVRYEDLILDPVGSRRAMETFIGVKLDHALPPVENAAMAAHRTSRDPLSSIGRWRTDLTAHQIAACEEAFADYMRLFDYAPASTAAVSAPMAQPAPAPAPAAVSEPVALAPIAPAPVAPPPVTPAPVTLAPVTPAPLAPARPGPLGGVTLAAVGHPAVVALHGVGEAMEDTELGGAKLRPVLMLHFGRDKPDVAMLGPGWSQPEPGFVWSIARQSHVALPPLREPGHYRVWIAGSPMQHPEALPEQTIIVLINGTEIGQVQLSAPSVLAFDLPPAAMTAGGKIVLTLRMPNAARPVDLGIGNDDRLLGFCLRWLVVLRHLAGTAAQTAD